MPMKNKIAIAVIAIFSVLFAVAIFLQNQGKEAKRIGKLGEGYGVSWDSMSSQDQDAVCDLYATAYKRRSGSQVGTHDETKIMCRACLNRETRQADGGHQKLIELAYSCLKKASK